jgi:4-hydroxy-4-methyl-2-oxoglutarate aldolase
MRSAADREAIRQRLLLVDASNVADVLDTTLGFSNQGLSSVLSPYPASSGKLAGWAYTIRGQMSPYELGGDPDKMKACAGVSTGDVAVWSGDGEGVCYFGELIAIGMKERGCVGSLVDGGIRDIRWIADQDFPVFARYRTPAIHCALEGQWLASSRKHPRRHFAVRNSSHRRLHARR